MKDEIYKNQIDVEPFKFNKQVAFVFDDMVSRSVPGYHETHALICDLIDNMDLAKGGVFYDLGSSTGTLIAKAASRHGARFDQFVGIDLSEAMIDQARAKWGHLEQNHIQFACADICDYDYKNAGVVVLSYTLQFVNRDNRLGLLKKIHDQMRPGSVLFLSEKIVTESSRIGSSLIKRHEAFKHAQGYSLLEIAQKRKAIENVLVPDTIDAHVSRLKSAGFAEVEPVWQWLNFAMIAAIKT